MHPELMKSFDGPARGANKGKVAEALDVAIPLNVGADLNLQTGCDRWSRGPDSIGQDFCPDYEAVASSGLNEMKRQQIFPSGRQSVVKGRVHWALEYLNKADLIERVAC